MDNRKYKEVLNALEELKLDNVEHVEYANPKFKWEYAMESITERGSKFRKRVSHA